MIYWHRPQDLQIYTCQNNVQKNKKRKNNLSCNFQSFSYMHSLLKVLKLFFICHVNQVNCSLILIFFVRAFLRKKAYLISFFEFHYVSTCNNEMSYTIIKRIVAKSSICYYIPFHTLNDFILNNLFMILCLNILISFVNWFNTMRICFVL